MGKASHPRRSELSIHGETETHPIEVSSDDNDSGSDVPKCVVRREGSTNFRDASHSPAPPFGVIKTVIKTDLRHTSHLGIASKTSSMSDHSTFSRDTRLIGTKDPTCEKYSKTKWRCIHDLFGNEDPVKVHQTAIPRLTGPKSVIQATTQQPISQGTSSDGMALKEMELYPGVIKMPVPSMMQQSLSRDRSPSDSSEDSDPPFNRSQKRRLPPRLPTEPNSQAESSEDSGPPIHPSQKRRLATGFPFKSRRRPGSSEDFNPPMTSAHRRPLTRSRRARLEDADTSDPSPTGSQREKSQMSGSVGADSSDSDASLVPSWNKTQQTSTPSSLDHHLDYEGFKSVLQTKGTEDSRIGKNANAEVRAKRVRQDLRSPKGRKSKQEKVQPNVTLSNKATRPVKKRPKFGLENIIPDAGTQKVRSFTLADIIPSKTPREPIPPPWSFELKKFHDALRMSFAPVVVGPDWILNAPVKKRKFTLADVTGTRPQEHLFSIEYALEQYQAHQGDQEQQSPEHITDQAQNLEETITFEQGLASDIGDPPVLAGSTTSEERPVHASHNMIV